eukprot:5645220-Pleurochrysis_carterae.AAC.2
MAFLALGPDTQPEKEIAGRKGLRTPDRPQVDTSTPVVNEPAVPYAQSGGRCVWLIGCQILAPGDLQAFAQYSQYATCKHTFTNHASVGASDSHA